MKKELRRTTITTALLAVLGASGWGYAVGNTLLHAQEVRAETAPVVLPIEVMGAQGTVNSAVFDLTAEQAAAGSRLWLMTHGVSYPDKVGVRVNDGAVWRKLSNKTVRIESAQAAAYGGIGGPINAFPFSIPLDGSFGILREGANTVEFRFEQSDDVSSGFRILKLNIQDSSGKELLPASAFMEDDPLTWKGPSAEPATIARGKKVWSETPLRSSPRADATMLKARCADCHAQDGRDLQYFNYSNLSIAKRAQFHGLSASDGDALVSYIRSLPGPRPGRPWNPPFQPGAGLDAKPAEEWSAGAGLGAVLKRDADTLPAIFPNGISAEAVKHSARLNVREIPIAFPLPDWNKWLPSVHPKDSFPAEWERSGALKIYAGQGTATDTPPFNLRKSLGSGDAAYRTSPDRFAKELAYWDGQVTGLIQSLKPRFDGFPRPFTDAIYSMRQWEIVKAWELHQEFGLSELPRQVYGDKAEARGWFGDGLWNAAPHGLVEEGNPYIGLSPLVKSDTVARKSRAALYFNNAWFYLALITDTGNPAGESPINWEYFQKFLNGAALVGDHEPLRQLVVGAQASQKSLGPDAEKQHLQWMLTDARLSQLNPELDAAWVGFTPEKRRATLQAYLDAWVEKSALYRPEQYRVLGFYGPEYVAGTVNPNSMGYGFYLEFQMAARLGLNNNRAVDWAKRMWPAAPAEWDKIRSR